MSDWIEWKGGECPVPDGVTYDVRFRADEDDSTDTEVIRFDADGLRWTHTGGLGDIVAYRLLGIAPSAIKPAKQMILPADPAARKGIPITTGVVDYFPLALAEVARVSKAGNDQHNPGQPLHWSKGKSTDHADCIPRHLIDRGSLDADGQRHTAKLAWRALALLQIELENETAARGAA